MNEQLAPPFKAIISKHLSLWKETDPATNGALTLSDHMENAMAEALALRDKNWEDGNATLRHERDEANSHRAALEAEITDLRFAADGFKAIAASLEQKLQAVETNRA